MSSEAMTTTTTKTVAVPSISCGHCVATIERELKDLDGVIGVTADAQTKHLTVQWQLPATWGAIRDLLAEIGYAPA